MPMEKKFTVAIGIVIAALVLTTILSALRQTALQSAYDNSKSFTINDSAGTLHTVAAAGISGDSTATLYAVAIGFVWFFAVVGILLEVATLKHAK